MEHHPTVSIIVPVYNAEATLRRCIDSILNQEYADFELLLVDDGSKDASGEICDQYALRDSRVHVTHKKNTGVSDTRNTALAIAQGDYLQFLDSDDWITPDATSLLVRTAEKNQCDLVISDFYRVIGDRLSRKGDISDGGVLSREEYAAYMMENPADFYYGVLWNKLYRREIVERHQLRMNAELNWCEDFMFNLEYIRHAETFCALPVPIYYYVKSKGSLANSSLGITKIVKMKLMIFEYYNRFYKYVLDEEEYEKSRLKVYRFLIDAAGDGAVPPSILPSSKRLGEERASACPEPVAGEGILADAFRCRKLLEHYLETAALKNDLTLAEAKLLFALPQTSQAASKSALADFAGMTRSSLSMTLQKLSAKGLIVVSGESRQPEAAGSAAAPQKKQLTIQLTPLADPVLSDLATAQQDYERAVTAELDPEELAACRALTEKIRLGIRKVIS